VRLFSELIPQGEVLSLTVERLRLVFAEVAKWPKHRKAVAELLAQVVDLEPEVEVQCVNPRGWN